MSDHAYLPPSSAATWSKCSAYPAFNELNPHGLQRDSDASVEGTLAHACLAAILAGTPGAAEPDSPEMRRNVEWAARQIPQGVELHIEEQQEPCEWLGPDVWGTPDLWWLDGETLHVADYKHGFGFVEVVGNLQLASYAGLIMSKLPKTRERRPVVFHILQPRNFDGDPHRTWATDSEWVSHRILELGEAAKKARTAPEQVTGDHCKYCPGRLACSAFKQKVSHAVDIAMNHDVIETPDAETLALRLEIVQDAVHTLDAMHKALVSHGTAKLNAGEKLPGFHMKAGRGTRKWKVPDERVIAAGFSKPKALTPSQAKDAGASEALIKRFSEVVPGEMKLSRIDNTSLLNIFLKG